MNYRIEKAEHLQCDDAPHIEGDISSIPNAVLKKLAGSKESIHSFKRSLENGDIFLITMAPTRPVFKNISGKLKVQSENTTALSSNTVQYLQQRFAYKMEKSAFSSYEGSLSPAEPIEDYQPEPIVSSPSSKSTYEYNVEIASSDASFRATIGCSLWLSETKEDILYGRWEQQQTKNGTLYTVFPSVKEPKHLTAKIGTTSKNTSIPAVSVCTLGSGLVHEAYIPVMPAIQVGERLGFPTQGYYYHFKDAKLVQEYKIIGEGKPVFFGTSSHNKQLFDDQRFNNLQTAILIHWKIHGQLITNQHLMYREDKLTSDELAKVTLNWLNDKGVQIDINNLLKVKDKNQLPLKQNFPAQEPATYNTPVNSHYEYPQAFISGSSDVMPINSLGKIKIDIPIINLKPEKILRIGVFFDGTGQNRKNDIYKEKYGNKSRTNVARLFEAYPVQSGKSNKIYVSGVGTVDDAWQTPTVIDTGKDEQPLTEGTGVDQLLSDTGAFHKWQNLLKQLNKIIKTTDEYDKITHIAFDVFGFSRGAALARHFINATLEGLPDYTKTTSLINPNSIRPHLLGNVKNKQFYLGNCYKKDNKRNLSVRFAGLFDTVGSFHWPGNDDEGCFKLKLNPLCAHKVFQLTAHHEYRKNFPLTSLKNKGKLPDNFYEEAFPGCHTDVGGGYPPKGQYAKQDLPKRLGFPIESTYNRELINKKSYEEHYNLAMSYRGGRNSFEVFIEQQRQKQEKIWLPLCQKKFMQYGAVRRDSKTLYYYRLQPINNGLAGLSLERMKQQAKLVGIEWKEDDYEAPKDFTSTLELKKLAEKLNLEPLGSITPASWEDPISRLASTTIHRSHDTAICKGYNTVMETLINGVSRNAEGSLEREVFDNA